MVRELRVEPHLPAINPLNERTRMHAHNPTQPHLTLHTKLPSCSHVDVVPKPCVDLWPPLPPHSSIPYLEL